MFLVSPSRTPCGVETFARHLARSWAAAGHQVRQIAMSGRASELSQLWRALGHAEALVINAPVVAWKRVLLVPLICIVLARVRGRKLVQIVHEWSDLDPRRRILLSIHALFATHILYSSPAVRDQHRSNLLARLLPVKAGLIPIPPNIESPRASQNSPHPLAIEQLTAARTAGRLIIGHFGSIYPRKRSDRILEIAAELQRRGHDVLLAYIGDFVRGSDDIQDVFRRRIAELDLADNVLITGYIESHADVFAVLRETDVLVYAFADGLSSRRGSVLAALLSGRPVIVNAPQNQHEFDHHPAFRGAIATGGLRLVAAEDICAYADAVERARGTRQNVAIDFDQCWRDAASAFEQLVRDEPVFTSMPLSVPAE
ncbi:MAG: glycosyltransferase family 4 protein [Methylobacteriaceae bacterium]|nr:glycosyltransferase family 4 protein [Methylobacteriaceae bacterium]